MQKKEAEANIENNVEMPNVTGLDLNEAKKVLKDINLEVEIYGEEIEGTIVTEQVPKKGIQVYEGTKVTLYIN